MSEETSDQRVAKTLGMNPEQIGHIRNEWNDRPHAVIIREIIADQIQQHVIELERKIRKVTPEGLANIQGALDAFEKAISTVKSRL